MAVKFAVLHLYLRLLACNATTRWMIYIGMVYSVITNLVAVIVLAILNSPQRDWLNWLRATNATSGGPVNELNMMSTAVCALNFVSDLYILFLPLPVIWNLHLPTKKRVGLVAIFGTGSLGCAASLANLIVRIRYMAIKPSFLTGFEATTIELIPTIT
ncbi:MAG: hypothetical protein Q9226_007105, partial [Calogaya cf. arnoldii]